MSDKKITAVEWLIESLIEMEFDLRLIPHTILRAKQLEKEQIMNSWLVDGYTDLTDENWKKEFEDYYKETYETQND